MRAAAPKTCAPGHPVGSCSAKKEIGMKSKFMIAAAAIALLMPLAASAQFLGKNEEKTTSNAYPQNSLSPKPTKLNPYVAPNKPHWKLSEILASHRGQTDWVQPIVRNKHQEADYISM